MTAVIEKTEAQIRKADAAADRDLRKRKAELELEATQRQLDEEARERAKARKARNAQVKRTTRLRKQQVKRRARRLAAEQFRARFQAALAGRLVLLLVASAVATAWHGQYGYLHAPVEQGGQGLVQLFAVAGATALELLGLAMGAIVREAGEHRDRAVRARLVMWAVIAFSAWSNLTHNGVVLAALSVLGPTAWEIHEWWHRRAKLHAAGQLRARPVRPRFPLDQVVLFPLWTLAAYRVAVRDRIEDTNLALSVAATERAARKSRRALARQSKKWAPVVRALVDRERQQATEQAAEIMAEAQATIGAAALLLGPESLRQVAEMTETTEQTTDGRTLVATETGPTVATETTEQGATEPTGQPTGADRPATEHETGATEATEITAWRRRGVLTRFRRQRGNTDDRPTGSTTEPTGSTTEATGDRPTENRPTGTTGTTGMATEATEGRETETPTETTEATERRLPSRPATEQTTEGTGDRPTENRPTGTTETTETTETTGVDVSDLLPDAMKVARVLGARLSRDALLTELRSRGHKVGGRRRDAIYDAVRPDRPGVSHDQTDQAAA